MTFIFVAKLLYNIITTDSFSGYVMFFYQRTNAAYCHHLYQCVWDQVKFHSETKEYID
jgi:hypothetical protein